MILRTITLVILSLTVFPACSEKTEATDIGFWPWFESREAELADFFSYETRAANQDDPGFQKKTEDTVAEVGEKLREVHPEFSPFFGYSDGTNKLFITVHGQAEHFTAVDEFIASAPEIDGWTFIALKQPLSLGADTEVQSGTAKLKAGDWHYTKTKNADGSFDFVIYIPNQVSDDPEGFERLFSRLATDFLGERFASTVMGDIRVNQLTDDAPDGLLPFIDIHADVSQSIKGG